MGQLDLGPKLYHGCISGLSWLSFKMYDLHLIFQGHWVNFNMKIYTFLCKHDNSTDIYESHWALLYVWIVLAKFEDR